MSRGYKSGKQSAGSSKAYDGIPKMHRIDQYHRDIVMARAMSCAGESWFLKGGNALIWRDPAARATKDLDLYNRASQIYTTSRCSDAGRDSWGTSSRR